MAMTSSTECGLATAAGRWSMPGGSVMSMGACSAPPLPSTSGKSLVPAGEPLDGRLGLMGVEQLDARQRLALHGGRQQVAEALVEHPLRARDRGSGGEVERGDQRDDGGVEAVGGHERVEEPVAVH